MLTHLNESSSAYRFTEQLLTQVLGITVESANKYEQFCLHFLSLESAKYPVGH